MAAMVSLPAAAAIANATKTASNGRFLFFSSSLSHTLDHYRRPFCVLRPTFRPVHKDKVGRIWNNGARFPFSFCTASSTEPVTTDAAAATATATASSSPDKELKDAADMLDIRVGRIIKAWAHQEADSLYVEEVDVGEPEPRLICSGLVKYMPLDQLQDRTVVVLANLKPRNMRGVKSSGMLMAASDLSHENVELLSPPEGSIPGERVWFGSEEDKQNQPDAATPNQIQKKKIWELVQPHLRTDASCTAVLGPRPMRTSAGLVTSTSLKHANIS